MTTYRDEGGLLFECDRCGVTEEVEPDESFRDAWAALKESGWRSFKNVQGEWEHRCPACVGKDYKK